MIKHIVLILILITCSSAAQAVDFSSLNRPKPAPKANSVVFRNAAPQQQTKIEQPKPVAAPLPTPKMKIYNGDIKIVALVNGEIISTEDIENRVNAFTMTTRIPLNSQTKNMIVQRVLQSTIDEKIKLQDAEKNGIKISSKDIDNSIVSFEKSNNIPVGKLKDILKKENVKESVFRDQMKSDLAWIRLIRRKMMADSELTQKEINEAIKRTENDFSKPKYLVSEILIQKDNARNLQDLVANLRQDPRFELYAMQFSQSPSSSSGGKLGWVNQGQLPPPLEKALQQMKPGSISEPIKVGGDYYILKLEKSFDPKKDKPEIPSKEEMKKFLENKRMEDFSSRHLQYLRQQSVTEVRN